MNFCINCGAKLSETDVFCQQCGTPVVDRVAGQTAQNQPLPAVTASIPVQIAKPIQPVQPVQPVYAPAAPAYQYSPSPKKKGKGVWIALSCIFALIIIVGVVVLVSSLSDKGGKEEETDNLKVSYSYLTASPEVNVTYDIAETIYPNLYSTMDSVVNLTATCENGETDVIVKVEVVGFTQPYEKKVTLNEQITRLLIKPAVLTTAIDLSSSKDAQVNISVVEADSGKTILQDTKIIKLMSIYDFMLWDDNFGSYNMGNALAWLTPESEGILALRRTAIDWMSEYTGGQFNSLAGYQLSSLYGADVYYLNTAMQVVGIQAAMSEMGIRYNMGSFSMTEGLNQRVLLPDDVIYNSSGVCIETALVMASALQSANMHVMLVFPPGHAQVAVETWTNSGSYYLIETTMLPFTGTPEEINSLITEYDAQGWANYLADPWGNGSGGCYVVDCDMAPILGITGLVQ